MVNTQIEIYKEITDDGNCPRLEAYKANNLKYTDGTPFLGEIRAHSLSNLARKLYNLGNAIPEINSNNVTTIEKKTFSLYNNWKTTMLSPLTQKEIDKFIQKAEEYNLSQ